MINCETCLDVLSRPSLNFYFTNFSMCLLIFGLKERTNSSCLSYFPPCLTLGKSFSLKNFFLFQILFRVFGIGQIPSPYGDPCPRHFHNIQSRAQRINMDGNILFSPAINH